MRINIGCGICNTRIINNEYGNNTVLITSDNYILITSDNKFLSTLS